MFLVLKVLGVIFLLNMLGVKNVKEVIFVVEFVYEVLGSFWVKLEIYLD